MASHESALKAHRQNIKHRERNRQFRARMRSALRAIRAFCWSGSSSSYAAADFFVTRLARRDL